MGSSDKLIEHARRVRQAGDPTRALEILAPALASAEAPVAEEAGLASDALGRRDEAIRWFNLAVQRSPQRVSAWVNLCAVLAESGQHAAAAQAARSATQLAPTFIPAWVNLGSSLAHIGDYAGAIEAYSKALTLAPNNPDLLIDLASALFVCGEVGPAIHHLLTVLRADPRDLRARSLFLLALHHATNEPAGLAREHAEFARGYPALPAPASTASPYDGGIVRVGLVGGDFRRHSVWYFLEPLLERLPQLGIELHCFHTDRAHDDITPRWQAAARRFVSAAAFDDDALEASIRESNPHVLISLAGHTTAGRPELFLRRIAPVQASFLGYPSSIGSPNVDVWIADEAVAPTGDPISSVWGGIARLPHSYFCFQPATNAVLESLHPDGPVVFGSFNVLGKISAVTVRLWAAVLQQIPSAILVVKNGGARGPAAQRLEREFAAAGIAAGRLRWHDWSATRESHLARYREIDIALDSFPYNGATTSCEALWMGVPVVSLAGKTPASRMGLSILRAAGCEAWVAHTERDFVEKAVALAKDVTLLRAQRAALRAQVATSPLCDGDAYAAHFAALLRDLAAGRRSDRR